MFIFINYDYGAKKLIKDVSENTKVSDIVQEKSIVHFGNYSVKNHTTTLGYLGVKNGNALDVRSVDTVQIFVDCSGLGTDPRVLCMSVHKSQVGIEIKKQVELKTGVPTHCMWLTSNARCLEDYDTLSHYNIGDNSTIYANGRLPACCPDYKDLSNISVLHKYNTNVISLKPTTPMSYRIFVTDTHSNVLRGYHHVVSGALMFIILDRMPRAYNLYIVCSGDIVHSREYGVKNTDT